MPAVSFAYWNGFQRLVAAILCFGSAGQPLFTKAADGPSVSAADAPRTAAEVYGEMVRPTPWLSPEAQRQGFHLPPDFEIRLFAAEPQIAKPLNMAVDQRGRLWVTQTTAYPIPAPPEGSPTDAVMVLEDTDGDGFANRVTTFADHLNIPIGVLPYGEGCICFSIPNLYYLRDTTGDGICDRRDVLLGPFDTSRDTHGLVNSLRDGGDGWIYACHGFNNRSTVAGTDGHQVFLESGNTFRFRPDGSRIEQVTHGQVNPFGMTRDDWGYWYSADCHSKPITQLIRGASYPSFGRPHDGLGFLPPTVDHLHGSTAISGILAISAESPIVPLRGQILSGNVMTSRLNRNRLIYQGATARGQELPDFLTSDDPWFRPVDLQLDQHNNIYVADFYNKIIGHYEVPLDHPDRDRTSGRIWQIRYAPAASEPRHAVAEDRPATLQVTDAAPQSLEDRIRTGDARRRIEALGLAGEMTLWPASLHRGVLECLDADNAHVVRAAAESLGLVPSDSEDILRLAQRLVTVSEDDPVLRQTLRIAICNRFRQSPASAAIWDDLFTAAKLQRFDDEIASVLLAVDRAQVVGPLLRYLKRNPDGPLRRQLIRHVVSHADSSTLDAVVQMARVIAGQSITEQHEMLDALHGSQAAQASQSLSEKGSDPLRRGQKPNENDSPPKGQTPFRIGSERVRQWALQLSQQALARFMASTEAQPMVLAWTTTDGEPWAEQSRHTEDGAVVQLRSSHLRGESYVGSRISDPFTAPATMQFRLAGHSGHPRGADHGKNYVRLVRARDGGVIRQAAAPRTDVAELVRWDLEQEVGQSVRLESHDGDSSSAYAWIAIGQFEPSWLNEDASLDALRLSLQWTARMRLEELIQPLTQLLTSHRYSPSIGLEIALAIAKTDNQRQWEAVLAGFRLEPHLIASVGGAIERFLAARSASEPGAAEALLDEACQLLTSHLSAREELRFARQWIERGATAEGLLRMCEAGWLSPTVLIDETLSSILQTRMDADARQRWQKLTSGLEMVESLDQRQIELVTQVEAIAADIGAGREVFSRHCAACHQLRGVGSLVGPQLDGAISRSNIRLIEDIVIPDRNVDEAFRTTSLLLDDGRAIVGMIQAENESTITLADPTGKSFTVPSQSVQMRIDSQRSLMPGNFSEVLSSTDLANLLIYLRQG